MVFSVLQSRVVSRHNYLVMGHRDVKQLQHDNPRVYMQYASTKPEGE